jgi:signal peptidase I
MNFPLILVVATVLTGIVWVLDAVLWAPKRRARVAELTAQGAAPESEPVEQAGKEPLLVEYARSFFPIILIVLLVRSFVVEPFRIPSGSMMPTLLVGDFILVNKFSYGLRLPVLHTKLLDLGEPERGDIVVFRYPEDPSVDYIKRVIGVPGDTVSYVNKELYINGKPIPQEHVGTFVGGKGAYGMTGADIRREMLDDVTHRILIDGNRRPAATERAVRGFVVPDGQYFVMGDNRDNSRDSRFWGTVPEENLVGRAFMIWMHWDGGDIEWSRIGSSIE